MRLLVFAVLERFLEDGEDQAADDGADEDGDKIHQRVANGRDDEDTAVRCAQRAVEGHRQSTRDGGADDAGRDDA